MQPCTASGVIKLLNRDENKIRPHSFNKNKNVQQITLSDRQNRRQVSLAFPWARTKTGVREKMFKYSYSLVHLQFQSCDASEKYKAEEITKIQFIPNRLKRNIH